MGSRDRVEVDLIVKAIAEGFGKVNKDMTGLSETAKDQGGIANFLKKNWASVVGVIGTARIAVEGLKKAWDFAKQGAEVIQTGESFDFLMQKLGASTDLMDQLRGAAKGTITDFQLQASTMTLLAGTSDTLGAALAQNTPQLLEIAKAANKLNPTLGSTDFLYQSLATGIKRSSTLILDNLGLTIKVGAANEAWADKMGITVDMMTAENKQMALLEAALKSGDALLQQVGGNTDAAGDSFAKLETATGNLANLLKSKLAPFLADAADAAWNLLTWSERLRDVFGDQVDNLFQTADGYVEYAQSVIAAGEAAGVVVLTQDQMNEELAKGGIFAKAAEEAYALMSREQYVAAKAAVDYSDAAGRAGQASADAEKEVEKLAVTTGVFKTKMAEARDASNQLWDDLDTGIDSVITGWLEKIEFMQNGGVELATAVETVGQALKDKLISPPEAEALFNDLLLDAEALKVKLGDKTPWEAAQTMADEVGGSVYEWYDTLLKMDGMRMEVVLDVITDMTRARVPDVRPRGSRGGVVARAGGGMMVPGQWHMLGEMGAEAVSPWGEVFDARTTRKMIEAGFLPSKRMAVVLDPGGGGGSAPPTKPRDPGAGSKDPTRTPSGPLTGTSTPRSPGAPTPEAPVVIQEAAITESSKVVAEAAAAVAGSSGIVVAQQVSASVKQQIAQGKMTQEILEEIRELLEEQPAEIGSELVGGLETLDIG